MGYQHAGKLVNEPVSFTESRIAMSRGTHIGYVSSCSEDTANQSDF